MGAHTEITKPPEVSAVTRKEDEIIKKIRKLRWIGLHDEAFQLERRLLGSMSAEVVRSGPIGTD